MKNIFFLCVLLISGQVLSAQNIVDSKFNHLKEKDNATVINISGKMFSLASAFQNTEDEDLNEMATFASKITGFKLLALENDVNSKREYNSGLDYINEDFDELMQIRSKDGNFSLYVDETDNVVHELVGIGTDNKEFVVFSLTGEMDLKKIGEFASEMQMDGMEKLESIKDFNVADVKVYPNPVSRGGDLNVDIPEHFDGGMATLFNESGRVVKTYNIDGDNLKINDRNLSTGLYYIEISKDAVSVKKKVVIID